MTQDSIDQNVSVIQNRVGGSFPRIALILGSGLGPYADTLSGAVKVSYNDIPSFPNSTVAGHAGQLVVGEANGIPLACMQGRMHLYEGYEAPRLAIAVRTLKRLGVDLLIITNAAGGMRSDLTPGSLMLITDHINFSGQNPLTGPNDDSFGVRFPDMTNAYDSDMREAMLSAAQQQSVDLKQGVYLQLAGPSFETPAEIRMLKTLGADGVGMSTVPECIVARHCGIKVVGLSVITNLAAGMADHELTHQDTMEKAELAFTDFRSLIDAFLASVGPSYALDEKSVS